MSAASFWKYVYLSRFSQPEGDRLLFRLIRECRPRRLAEIGIPSLTRSRRAIEVAQRFAAGDRVEYTGLDRFDARLDGQPRLSLKRTHRELKGTGAKVRLVPGDPPLAVTATANQMLGLDLLVFSANIDLEAFGKAWFYVPRMLQPSTLVLREIAGEAGSFERLEQAAIETWASQQNSREAA